jgi:hypothetical protein
MPVDTAVAEASAVPINKQTVTNVDGSAASHA